MSPVQPFLFGEGWIPIRDGNPTGLALYRRHYSHRAKSGLTFVGPGESLVLITPDARALFVWRKFRSDNDQTGINCAVFRNEGEARGSDLIRAAQELAWARWPDEPRHYYTYVNPRRVQHKRQPGRCFLKAGWRYVRDHNGKPRLTTKRLLILEHIRRIQ